MAKVELKQPVVQAISEDVKDASSVVLVDYRGLTVAQDTELRKQLREAGIVYKVCKNTMMKRAFEGTDFAALDEHLEGPSAIAIAKEDATASVRILCKFAKEVKALELKAGVVDGALYDAAALTEISKIPSKEELLSKLLGSLQSPITNLARVLNQIAEQGGAVSTETAAPAEEAKAVEEAPAEEAKAEEAPAEEAKAAEEAPVEEAKAVEEAPVEEAKAAEEAPVEEAKAAEEAPVEEAKEAEKAPAKKAPAKKAPAKKAKAAEEAPAEEAKAAKKAPAKKAPAKKAPAKKAKEAPVEEAPAKEAEATEE